MPYFCCLTLIDSGELRDEKCRLSKKQFDWKNMCETWEMCKSSKKWWILTFFMPEVTGDISTRAVAAVVSPHLCKNSPAPIVKSSRTPGNKIVMMEMVPYLWKTANLIEPSRWIVAEDVVVRAAVAELLLQSYFSYKRWWGGGGQRKSSWCGTVKYYVV